MSSNHMKLHPLKLNTIIKLFELGGGGGGVTCRTVYMSPNKRLAWVTRLFRSLSVVLKLAKHKFRKKHWFSLDVHASNVNSNPFCGRGNYLRIRDAG